ncbi:MAG: His/Gly/Thr/Pro-type tRNA ligase C-terminal domain-containing protein, partial [Planctomycetota bacterium]|nr:His/Gly/Thr/Pro-type tRNA ligase C-terminal domain-containing protein [Planctomycetota bacterium]
IGEMYAKWIQSYRDLPLLINQWANVVRWEMRTRLFLRTAEFLWQEGHTAHATRAEAEEETRKMLDVYADFAENWMAMPVIKGEKTAEERFPGAVATYSIEAMMQDRKALQAGTSHFLGQNFSRAQDITFQDENGAEAFAWTTSWGVSTRLVGGLIMTHGDDDGMIVPPRLAPQHVVILPVLRGDDSSAAVLEYCAKLKVALENQTFNGAPVRVLLDQRDIRGGEKTWQHIKRGVPLRVEIGPRDVESDSCFVGRRDQSPKQKESIPRSEFVDTVHELLESMQRELFTRALENRQRVTKPIDSLEEFRDYFTPDPSDPTAIHGGFAQCHFAEGEPMERVLKELKVSLRCVPLDAEEEDGTCIFSKQPSRKRAVFAKAY